MKPWTASPLASNCASVFNTPDKSMDAGENSLPATINPSHFPAKLWRLVNDPANRAIFWDSLGEVIVVDQQLFEKQILSQGAASSRVGDVFKTSSFSSFVRQLNLYGFRKGKPDDSYYCSDDSRSYHHFFNPNFKRSHPELVANLRRLTVENKAKLQAVSSSLPRPKHQKVSHPCHLPKPQAVTEHIETPAPSWYLTSNQGAAHPPFFAPKEVIPPSINQPYAEVPSNYNPVHIQQCSLSHAKHGNPNITCLHCCNGQYHPSYYSPVSQYYHPNLVAGSGVHTGLVSPQNYYQAGYPFKMWCIGKNNQDLHIKNKRKKLDVNLDSAFQIADEMLPVPPTNCALKVMTPEKQGVVLELFSNISCTVYNSTKNANPLFVTSNTVSVIGNNDEVTCIQDDKSVISVPEQLPEDAIL